MGRQRWHEQAVDLLASGTSIADVARAVGVARETISRTLHSPGSPLKAEVDRRRATLAAATNDKRTRLVDGALSVLEIGLRSQDRGERMESAKTVLGRLLPAEATVRVEQAAVAVVPPEEAVAALAQALGSVPALARAGAVSSESLTRLREAAASVLDALANRLSVPEPVEARALPAPAEPMLAPAGVSAGAPVEAAPAASVLV